MNLNEITAKVKELSSKSSGKIESKIKFVFNDGCIFIDDTVNPTIINNENQEADCTITISNDDFGKILNKEMDSMGAFMSVGSQVFRLHRSQADQCPLKRQPYRHYLRLQSLRHPRRSYRHR